MWSLPVYVWTWGGGGLRLCRTNTSDAESSFTRLNFPFLDNDVPLSASSGVCVYQLVQFAWASDCVADFDASCLLLTQKLLKQGYRYHKLCKKNSKFYPGYCGLVSVFDVGLGSL